MASLLLLKCTLFQSLAIFLAARIDSARCRIYESEHSFSFTALHTGEGGPMRRANVQAQSDRRAEILAAAQRCFVRSGFHGASMQDICAEAGMSPGNLYRYFPSKEALIA